MSEIWQDRKDEMIQMRKDGMSTTEIAKAIGCSTSTAVRITKGYGLTHEEWCNQNHSKGTQPSKAQKERIDKQKALNGARFFEHSEVAKHKPIVRLPRPDDLTIYREFKRCDKYWENEQRYKWISKHYMIEPEEVKAICKSMM